MWGVKEEEGGKLIFSFFPLDNDANYFVVEVPQILTIWFVGSSTGWAGWSLRKSLADMYLFGSDRIFSWEEGSWQTPISAFHLWLWTVWLPLSESSCLGLLHSDKIILHYPTGAKGVFCLLCLGSLSPLMVFVRLLKEGQCFKSCYVYSHVSENRSQGSFVASYESSPVS